MAMIDSGNRYRDALPSINHLDLQKIQTDNIDRQRFPMMAGLGISTAPLISPTSTYSGPPPPYSLSSSTYSSAPGAPGYTSSPASSRRTTVEEKEPLFSRQSLPSIHEALGSEKTMPYTTSSLSLPQSATSQYSSGLPSAPIGRSVPEAPLGPSNPFSQAFPPPSSKDKSYSRKPEVASALQSEPMSFGSGFTTINATEPRPQSSQMFGTSRSPRPAAAAPLHSTPPVYPESSNSHRPAPMSSPATFTPYRSPFAFSNQSLDPPLSNFSPVTDHKRFSQSKPYDEGKKPIPRSSTGQPFGESVKRHLEVFDAQLALNEIAEASVRTHDFSRAWAQRSNPSSRTGYAPESLPDLHEVEEMMQQSTRVLDALSKIREVVINQQNALAEQRARAARGEHFEDDINGFHDDSKGGFAGGDLKKRRGKAAPPGRCHSCNRAETPEWRRGPDGARTLCNACGLHYAKLTRKMGASKASSLPSSSVRPKNMDPHSPHHEFAK